MNVLVLGGSGFIGSVVTRQLEQLPDARVVVGSRNPRRGSAREHLPVDATNADSLVPAVDGMDAVVNCVTGDGATIRANALAVATAAQKCRACPRIVQLSSMAVYGSQQGTIDESASVSIGCNWYGTAKVDAERTLQRHAESGGSCTILRIGCVYGPQSALWVDRIGLLLKSGRLGDLGLLADGWSNLIHVQDIGTAVARAIQGGVIGLAVYNLSAPDSPRWNEYFRDFSLAARMVPLRYKTGFSMYLESRVLAPPLYALNRVLGSSALAPSTTQSIPPSLLRLFRQQIRLDSARASRELGLDWTLYRDGLAESVSYFKSRYES